VYDVRPGGGHFMRLGIDVCDNATSKSEDSCNPDHDHTRRSSPSVDTGGRRQSPASASRSANRTNNDDIDRSSNQQGYRT